MKGEREKEGDKHPFALFLTNSKTYETEETEHQTEHQMVFLIFFIFLFFFDVSLSDPQASLVGEFCGSIKLDSSPNFIPNFISSMEEVSRKINDEHWGTNAVLSTKPEIFTYAQCYGFLSHKDCLSCYSQTRTRLPKCLPSNSARIYLDGCFFRYDTYNFFKESLNEKHDYVKCSLPTNVSKDGYIGKEFQEEVFKVIENVTELAVLNKGFALSGERGGLEAVYAMAQCWMTVDTKSCKECLSDARNKLRKCAPATDGRVMNSGCYLRYSTEKFFADRSGEEDEAESSKIGIIIASILSAIALSMFALFGALLGYKRISQKKKAQNNLNGVSVPVRESSLNFKYEILEKATNGFDSSGKLGQGGAGSVFKGTLPDGRIVAVKRLMFNTRQWVDEFFNEVNLISGIQHKNVVKLLGCSIEGPESLLVYEYVPNRSLDQILFVKDTFLILNWQQRFDIIIGTAEGLAYLHGGCGEKIIHRDIKSSNILLDENLTPKIADFGLAKCVGPDQSHISTGIAGTLGYMAPEYLVRGQLTEKADVYAFGVLVLEVVCGRKNSIFTQGSSSVLRSVWKNYKANKILECVDPSFDGGYSVREASNVLQIGLLCTQTSLTLRPSMSEVVRMLKDGEYIIPSPTQAPFLNASILSSDETNQYSAASTSSSNFQTTTERSYYSSDHSFNEQLRTEVSSFHTAAESTTVDSAESSPSKCEASEIR
ncbi:cysteine-rich receptor-like protein kinase 42 [Quercus suber]|uniref:cysteine-rich receptor-like protein kinase 42 n=1 Tax=Quercus suber TaxID=58331 RepID=UPI0032DE3C80